MKTIRVLQAGRALAALAVVSHHAAASAETFAGQLPAWLRFITDYGYLGVDFFFVLSGFIIYYTSREHSLGHYVSSRLKRVFVPYLPVGIGMALAYTLLPGLSAGDRQWDWLATLTLLPGNTALIVAWTLQYEMAFYTVFALGMMLGRPVIVVASWVGLALVFNLVAQPGVMSPLLGTLTVEFLFGMLAVIVVERGWKVLALAPAAFAIFALTGGQARELFGLGMAAIIVTLVRHEWAGKLRTPHALVFLGAASYSIYLVHVPVCALAARLFDNWAAAFVIAFVAGTAAGVAYHLGVERLLLDYLNPHRSRSKIDRAAGEIAEDDRHGIRSGNIGRQEQPAER